MGAKSSYETWQLYQGMNTTIVLTLCKFKLIQ